MRDQLYALADLVVEAYPATRNRSVTPFDVIVGALTPAQQDEARERAAIAEVDGAVPRDRAERLALASQLNRSKYRH